MATSYIALFPCQVANIGDEWDTPQFIAWASPALYHCILQHNNLCGGLLVIAVLFVIVDEGVSGINELAGAYERFFGKGGNNVCTRGGFLHIVKELVDSGSGCCGPVGEMEYHLGPNTGGG